MNRFVTIISLLLIAGCFTISETKFPTVTFCADASVATNITVAVRGFDAVLTKYAMVNGYQTIVYAGGPYRYPGYGCGVATAHTTTIIPQAYSSDAFLEQAKSRMEALGFNIMAQTPDYVVETKFSGPVTTSGEMAGSIAWLVCSLLTCDRGVATWSAQLKIHDNRTGRLVLSREYSQKYEVLGFSPIPLFGISAYDRTSQNYMQSWCLSALTEQVVAEAAEFLTSKK